MYSRHSLPEHFIENKKQTFGNITSKIQQTHRNHRNATYVRKYIHEN